MNLAEWGLFLVAWAASYMAHAQNSVASTSNGLTSIRQWFKLNAGAVLFNLIISLGLGLIWTEAPLLFGALVEKAVPVTYGTALVMGVTVQSLIDRLMFMFGLKRIEMPRQVPPIIEKIAHRPSFE